MPVSLAPAWDAAAAVAACPVLPWSGDVWRCHGRRYPGTSAAGSLHASGRFHRARDKFPASEAWPALYTSLALHVALGERIRHTTPAALGALATQRLTRLRLELQAVLVTCAPVGCAELAVPGLDLEEMCQPIEYGKTQAFASVARELVEALLVPSCTRFPEGNLVLFPDRLRPDSHVEVLESHDPNLFVDWANLPLGRRRGAP